MVRKEYQPRKSLRDEHIEKIIGEGMGPESIRITIEHSVGDKRPIPIEIQKYWYGDTREKFKTDAEAYFTVPTILELDREIGGIVLDMVNVILVEIEKRHKEEIELRDQQRRGEQIVAAGPMEERLETESSLTALGDWRQPISVSQANHARASSIITVYGQIVSRGDLHAMLRGGQYQCGRCHAIQYIEYDRPSYPGDDEAPLVMNRICRDCGEEDLQQGTADYQRATQLHRVGIEDVRAVDIGLMDTEKYDAVDTLRVKLFHEDAKDVRIGEYVTIRGKFQLQQSPTNRRRYHGILYAHEIKYTAQTAYVLKPADFARVRRFVDQAKAERPIEKDLSDPMGKRRKLGQPLGEKNIIERLKFCYSRHRIVWNYPIKEALLYAETSAGPDVIGGEEAQNVTVRKRIHVGIVGDKGVGKSRTSESVKYHDERNRYVSAQGGTGKSMTALISKEGDTSAPILRIGPLAFAKEAVIVLNEFGEVSLEEQVHFQDAMEEGFFSINKYGIQGTIRADSMVIWTANPVQGASFSKGVVSLDQLAIRKQIIDRTDLLMICRPIPRDKRREFNHLRQELRKARESEPARWKILCNYDNYVKIHLMVAKDLARKNGYPKMTDEASQIIEEADSRLQELRESDNVPNAGSNRSLDTLNRLAAVIAMLKLKDRIEPADAKHAVAFYNESIKDVQTTIKEVEDPATLALNAIIFILQNESNGIPMKFKRLAELASERDQAIKWYLYQGPKNKLGNVGTNRRLRHVKELLGNISSDKIKQTNSEETEFLWVGPSATDMDRGDDEEDEQHQQEEEEQSHVTKEEDEGSPDAADKEKLGERVGDQSTGPPVQTKLLSPNKMPAAETDQPSEKPASATLAERHNKPLEEKEYGILKACEMAMSNYKDSKAQGKESGSLFEVYDVWYHLSAMYPRREWDVDKVRKAIKEQVRKGRVLTRAGDAPDRYYLLWRDDGTNAEGA